MVNVFEVEVVDDLGHGTARSLVSLIISVAISLSKSAEHSMLPVVFSISLRNTRIGRIVSIANLSICFSSRVALTFICTISVFANIRLFQGEMLTAFSKSSMA